MKKNDNTHYWRFDHRAFSLSMSIKGLSEMILVLKNHINENQWYDGDWFMEESEQIYGLAFISFQNYINSSIKDFAGSSKNKKEKYKLDSNPHNGRKTNIELIIGLANYAKHKDDDMLTGTKEILDHFNLNYENVTYLDKSPIFQGLTILNEDWDLFKIKEYVTEWREFLWSRND